MPMTPPIHPVVFSSRFLLVAFASTGSIDAAKEDVMTCRSSSQNIDCNCTAAVRASSNNGKSRSRCWLNVSADESAGNFL
jgi:hypothetical protein